MILKTPEEIHLAIEKKLKGGSTYIDSLIEYAKEHDLEIESVAEIIKKSKIMKEKVRSEASDRKMLKENEPTSTKFFD